jgi:hypothetical protein
VTLTPTSLAFPTTKAGTVSGTKTVVLKNTGTTTFYIYSMVIDGTAKASYKLQSTCGTAVAPGVSCNLNVAFAPTAVGGASAYIDIAADNPVGTKTIVLSGTGD